MSTLLKRHTELDSSGVGRCSVPMWCNGVDAGFCDNTAYGERPEGRTIRRWDGFDYRNDGLYAGSVPGLACPVHGGPKSRVFRDGNKYCAVRTDFTNLQESSAGFGDTPELARKALESLP